MQHLPKKVGEKNAVGVDIQACWVSIPFISMSTRVKYPIENKVSYVCLEA